MAILTVPDPRELESFVAAYPLGAVRHARGIEAGTVNTSYEVELESGRYFLRIYEQQGEEGAVREGALLKHLVASGIPTPEPQTRADGSLVGRLAGKPAALFPWVVGEMRCQSAVDGPTAYAVGEALAKVHVAGWPSSTSAASGASGIERFGCEDLARRCAQIAASPDLDAQPLGPALKAAIEAAFARRAAGLPTGLVHGDLFRDNVLWSGPESAMIAALLDFESAQRGPFVYDVAVTIVAWAYRDAFDLAVARALVAGYTSVRPLASIERDAMKDEAVLACLRFTITRITDDAARIGKRWQRFVARRTEIDGLGRDGFAEALGLR